MLFNSTDFLIYFPLVITIFFLIKHQYQWVWLLLASCYFYMMFKASYILILFLLIFVDYFAGILIEKCDGTRKKLMLLMSLLINFGLLAFFKYFNFAID